MLREFQVGFSATAPSAISPPLASLAQWLAGGAASGVVPGARPPHADNACPGQSNDCCNQEEPSTMAPWTFRQPNGRSMVDDRAPTIGNVLLLQICGPGGSLRVARRCGCWSSVRHNPLRGVSRF